MNTFPESRRDQLASDVAVLATDSTLIVLMRRGINRCGRSG